MKNVKGSKFLNHLPDAICFYRMGAPILALILGEHPAVPWLFSTALLSDLFDGWIFRKYVQNSPTWRSWNPLPLTLDPLADFALMLFGVFYNAKYFLRLELAGILGLGALTAIVPLAATIISLVIRSRMVRTVNQTVLTHVSCGLMILVTVLSWRVNYASWVGPILTLIAFYSIFLAIGDKGRLIRWAKAEDN